MANREHLAILKAGKSALDRFRANSPNAQLDLAGADLSDADACSVRLSDVDFTGANLRRARFIEASFRNANFTGADLRDVDARGIHLSDVNFTDANLEEVDARGIHMSNVSFTGANLRRARFTGASSSKVNFIRTDLRQADLRAIDMSDANFQDADLREAILLGTNFTSLVVRDGKSFSRVSGNGRIVINGVDVTRMGEAVIEGADFTNADLRASDLRKTNLSGAKLQNSKLIAADLTAANLSHADLTDADLRDANLTQAVLVNTKLHRTRLSGAHVYGISAWDLDLNGAEQTNLIVTPPNQPTIIVDNLEIAQFVYLLVTNPKIRNVIDTIGNKAVLILGRFTERKEVLEAVREEVRRHGYVPMVFDFERPADRDFTETVMTLAGMSRFIIADVTKPRSVPLELHATVPNYMIPFVPIIQSGEQPFAMFQDLWQKYRDWVLDPLSYDSVDALLKVFDKAIIRPANERHAALQARKAEQLKLRHVEDYQ